MLLVFSATPWKLQAATTISSGTTLSSLDFSTEHISISGGTSSISVIVNGNIIGSNGYTLSISNATVTQGSASTYKFVAGDSTGSTTGSVTVGTGGTL
ncbi:MAG: hypothetical protein EBR81_11195, partial [Proteobacteria bacterium]|nr:hypothetical protein [Pseudomonadota bacterium]